jgi:hypothetical protein
VVVGLLLWQREGGLIHWNKITGFLLQCSDAAAMMNKGEWSGAVTETETETDTETERENKEERERKRERERKEREPRASSVVLRF